ENPCINVTRNCPASTNGLPQTISGIVTNCGNVTLTNVVITDSVLGTITTVATLPPNGTASYSRTFTAVCPGNTNFTTAAATSICGTRVTANATHPCITRCPPPCIRGNK